MARIIKNKLIPFEGYSALTMFQCIWVREKYYEKVLNSIRTQDHEGTHMKQELEIDITVLILTILSALCLVRENISTDRSSDFCKIEISNRLFSFFSTK
jgi:hypothetical protein